MSQVITTKSWGSRLMSALGGFFVGIALIVGGFVLIFWNEGAGLHMAQSLDETLQLLVKVSPSPIDPQNNQRAVYFTGLATTEDQLQDKLLGVDEKAIMLERKVEMYQWQENVETQTESKLGGSEQETKTYTYTPVWSEDIINSANFREPDEHKNPSTMPIQSETQYAKHVTVGDYVLPIDLVKQMKGESYIELKGADTEALKQELNKPVEKTEDGLYVGDDSQIPKIGDMKISVALIMPAQVSVIAAQVGNTLESFLPPAGKPISLLSMGTKSPEVMIHNAQSENTMMMWVLRGVSLLMMVIGLGLLMQPLVILADLVPIFGSIAGFGAGIIAFAGGIVLWSIGLSIAWIAVRPIWSIGVVVVAVLIAVLVMRRKSTVAPAAR